MQTWLKIVLGVVIGAGLGFAYYYYVGCAKGTCAITSNPYISTAYGAVVGMLFVWPSRKDSPSEDGPSDDKLKTSEDVVDD